MKKKIKTIQIVRIDVPPEDEFEEYCDEEGMDYSFTSYNNSGNVAELIRFSDYGQMTGKSLYHYDDKGQLLGEETLDEEGNLEEKITFEHNSQGRINREYIHYLDDSKDTVHYEYNESGKLVRKVTMTDDEEVEKEENYGWEGEKLLFEEELEEGEIVKKNKYEYDENGNVVIAEVMNADEESRVENEYDEKGNRVKYIKFDSDDKPVEKHLFTYDDHNRIIEIVEEDRFKKNTVQIVYDEHGNAIRQTETNRHGGINHSLERDYDEDGNVTEVRASVGDNGGVPARKYILSYHYEFFE